MPNRPDMQLPSELFFLHLDATILQPGKFCLLHFLQPQYALPKLVFRTTEHLLKGEHGSPAGLRLRRRNDTTSLCNGLCFYLLWFRGVRHSLPCVPVGAKHGLGRFST